MGGILRKQALTALTAALGVVALVGAGCDDRSLPLNAREKLDAVKRAAAKLDAAKRAEIPRSRVTTSLPPRRPDRLRVASFNIQVFGTSKTSKPKVMAILGDTIRQFDLVAIQEIRSKDPQVIDLLLAEVNRQGGAYRYVIGPRLGRTSSQEQYAFVYDSTRLGIDGASLQTVDDPDDLLHREPLVARFVALEAPPQAAYTFMLLNVHTDPDEVAEELNVLDDVFLSAQADGRYEDDVIMLGDFNAAADELRQLGQLPRIHAAIQDQPTNTRRTKSYDNLVFDRYATAEFTGNAGVYDFQAVYELTDEQALDISDHFPVWAEFTLLESRAARGTAARPADARR